jgi:adenosylmethionine-8-amino-7-oxononanoate aminotransferase
MNNSRLLRTFLNESAPPMVEKGEGIYLHMKDGQKYMDTTGGFTAHAILGWTQPSVTDAIIKQANKITHIDYKTFTDENREKLADLLLSRAEHKLDRVYFVGGSGGEACEAAMKLSYQAHYDSGNRDKTWFISREQSYHGSSTDALAVGHRPNLDFYKPLLPKERAKIPEHNMYRAKNGDETLDEYARRSAKQLEDKILEIGPEKVCAFIGETIMGGLVGDVPPAPNYWKYIRKVCDQYDVHLILDEVWCGTGTSGKIYCIDWDGVTPDFIFMGKTLGAGFVPLSALITSSLIEEKIRYGQGQIQHSTTHQGHSLCVAAALAVQQIIHDDDFLQAVTDKGEYLRGKLMDELGDHPFFANVRGRGLRNSIEYHCEDQHLFGNALVQEMKENHSILISGKWHRVCFSPALTITMDELKIVLSAFVKTFKNVASKWDANYRSKVKIKPIF